ncbi:unnamed protein product [Lampetra planeri]
MTTTDSTQQLKSEESEPRSVWTWTIGSAVQTQSCGEALPDALGTAQEEVELLMMASGGGSQKAYAMRVRPRPWHKRVKMIARGWKTEKTDGKPRTFKAHRSCTGAVKTS